MPTRKPKKSFEMKKVNGIEIRQRLSDGYMDAMAICDACDKDFADYIQIRFTKRFLVELSRDTGINESDLIQKEDGVDGIWVHPQIAINLAQWASPKLAVIIPKWALEWSIKSAKTMEPTEKPKFVSSSGVKFEDIDPSFAAMISKAAKFNPDEDNTEP